MIGRLEQRLSKLEALRSPPLPPPLPPPLRLTFIDDEDPEPDDADYPNHMVIRFVKPGSARAR